MVACSDSAGDTPVSGGERPTADAGSDQIVNQGATVTLDGSASSDPENSDLRYSWQQISGDSVELSAADSSEASFVANFDSESSMVFGLSVVDVGGLEGLDEVTITRNSAPTAEIAGASSAYETTSVELSGAQSSDSDGSVASYLWSQVSGSAASFASTDAATTTLSLPQISSATSEELVLQLQVTDDLGLASTSSFTLSVLNDSNAPSISAVSVADGDYAIDDAITLTITATDGETALALKDGSTFNGQALSDFSAVAGQANTYTAIYTVASGDSDLAANSSADNANIIVVDGAGNDSNAITSVALGATTVDANRPTIDSVSMAASDDSDCVNDATCKVGDTIAVTITAGGNEADLELSSRSFNGQQLKGVTDNGEFTDAVTNNGNGTYTGIYTVTEGDSDLSAGDSVDINLSFTDAAGNVGLAMTSVTLSGLSIDANSPTIDSVSAAAGDYKVGDSVVVSITATDNEVGLKLNSTTFNTEELTIADNSDADQGNGVYIATYTVENGDPNVVSGGTVNTNLSLQDAAGNVGAAVTSVVLTGVSIDTGEPVIASVSIPNEPMKVDDVVVATFTVSNAVGENLALVSNSKIGGFDLGSLTKISDTSYTASFTIAEGGADVAADNEISVSVKLQDPAGNSGEYSGNISGDKDSIDANSPTIAEVKVTSTGTNNTHIVGNEVTVTITAGNDITTSSAETGLTLSSKKFNGRDLTTTHSNNGDGTYTFTYTVVEGDADIAAGGTVTVNLAFEDAAGNIGAATTSVSLTNGTSIDANSPTISAVSVASGTHKVASDVKITITASDKYGDVKDLTLSSKKFNDQDLLYSSTDSKTVEDNNDGTYTTYYTVVEVNGNGNDVAAGGTVTVDLNFTDAAGNTGTGTTSVTLDSDTSIDASTPQITVVSIPDKAMGIGEVTATITVSNANGEELTFVESTNSGSETPYIAGHKLTNLNKVENSDNTYTATLTIEEGGDSVTADSSISVSVQLQDPAGNESKLYETAISQDNDSIDAVRPNITSVSIPNETMGIGEVIATFTVNSADGEELKFADNATPSIGGYELSGLTKNSDTNYTATFTIEDGGSDVAAGTDISVSVQLQDPAGNESSLYEKDIDQNNDNIDANYPLIDTSGSDTQVNEVEKATLKASASDANGIASYSWQQVDSADTSTAKVIGEAHSNYVELLTASNANTTFTAPGVEDDDGTLDLYFRVTVTDNSGNSASAITTLTVTNTYSNPNITISAGVAPDFDQISLNWDADSSLTYSLYRSTDATCNVDNYIRCDEGALYLSSTSETDPYISTDNDLGIASITDTNQSNTGLEFFTTYYYWLAAALDSGEVVSLSSAQAQSTSGPQLNDTGIVDSQCSSTGNLENEDCEVGRDADASLNDDSDGHAGFSFTRLNLDGSVYTGNVDSQPWYCVRDNVSGLIWEVKTDDGTLSNEAETFTWYDDHGDDNANTGTGTASSTEDTQDTQDLIDLANDENSEDGLCGVTGWRLPTVQEIEGLTSYNNSAPAPDADYFPNTRAGSDEWYWTVELDASNSNKYWAYSAYTGSTQSAVHGTSYYARLVSSSEAVQTWFSEFNDDRYINTDEQEGTITDQRTGLMWMQCTYGETYGSDSCTATATAGDWQTAFAAVDTANTDSTLGHTDWRLPNRKELGSIVDLGNSAPAPAINTNIFPNTKTDGHYWTSTPSSVNVDDVSNADKAFTIDFATGAYGSLDRDTGKAYIRLVRDVE